jgi:uncharacterized protein (TIGR03437 family)
MTMIELRKEVLHALVWIIPACGLFPLPATGQFVQQGPKLVGSGAVANEQVGQGSSVALSEDGNTAIVGGPHDNSYAGAVWVFTRSGGVWTQQGSKLVGSGALGDAQQGSSVALSEDGNTAIVGAPTDNGVYGSYAGAAWVLTRSGGVWTQQAKLVGSGAVGGTYGAQQGSSVALSEDGNTAIVGGPGDNGLIGAAWVFTRSGGVWTQQGSKLVGNGAVGNAEQGFSVALSGDGNTAIVGDYGDSTGVGAVWVFTRSGGVWTQQGLKLVGSGAVGNAWQGSSVGLSGDGNTAFVGGPNDNNHVGAAWVFTRSGGVWTQQGSKLVGSGAVGNAWQGSSAGLSGDGNTAIVGGSYDNGFVGAAWAFAQAPTTVPLTTIGAVTSAASFQSGAVAPGEIVSIFGAAMGPATPAFLTLEENGNVSTSLGGAQVLFNIIPAPLTYVSSIQINAVVPYELPSELTPYVQVTYMGQTSNILSLTAAATAPALFTSNGSGTGPGAILNQDNSYNGPANPAARGSTVVVYMTGEGQTTPSGVTGKVTTVSTSGVGPLTPAPLLLVSALIAGLPALVQFAGEAPGLVSGVLQVNVRVPANAPTGNVPITISIGTNSSQKGVTVSVQ